MLSDSALIELIDSGESARVEFTAATRDLDKIRIAICAFANDLPNYQMPGVIFIGLNDNGGCADCRIDDMLLQTLGGLRSDGTLLPLPTMAVDKRTLRGCELAVVQVEPSQNPPLRMNGRCWVRIGPRRATATPEDERRLVEKRHSKYLPFDMQPVKGSSIETDLDMPRFEREYLPATVPPEILEENNRSLIEQLQALRLADVQHTPTVTAILMLGKHTRAWFPGAYIQFVRHNGSNVTDPIISNTEMNGTLPDQMRQLEELLRLNIVVGLDTNAMTHVEKPDYPLVALRELARNALIHRNYDATNTPVRISWFADRVEIISPGSVFGSVTPDNFGQPNITDYRNPTIAEAMKNMGFMQRFGIGIQTAHHALQHNGNPPPAFDIQPTLVLVTIKSAVKSAVAHGVGQQQ